MERSLKSTVGRKLGTSDRSADRRPSEEVVCNDKDIEILWNYRAEEYLPISASSRVGAGRD